MVKAYGGEKPVFQGNGEDIFIQSFGRYLVFDGLEITGYTRCAFNPKGGGKVTIRNCRMRRIQAQDYGAVTPQYCDSIVIEDNIFQESGRSLDQIQLDHAIYNAAGSHDIVIRRVSISIRPSNPVSRLPGRRFREAGAVGMVFQLRDPRVPDGLPFPEDAPVFDIGGRRHPVE